MSGAKLEEKGRRAEVYADKLRGGHSEVDARRLSFEEVPSKLTAAQRRCKTIYRTCTCGETAHDAVPVAGAFMWAHKCRNCGHEIAHWTRKPDGAVVSAPKHNRIQVTIELSVPADWTIGKTADELERILRAQLPGSKPEVGHPVERQERLAHQRAAPRGDKS